MLSFTYFFPFILILIESVVPYTVLGTEDVALCKEKGIAQINIMAFKQN